jgi:regulator of protease activity HflC (stomatin/prohibitin superfamily)
MKLKLIGSLFAAVVLLMFVVSSCTVVQPGYVGLQINKMGGNRGVSEIPTVNGLTFYNPFTTAIIEYPTFVQTTVYTRATDEGHPINEELTFNSKEGMVISADISLSYAVNPYKAANFYVKYRAEDLEKFTHGVLRNTIRDAFNEEATAYTVEELYGVKKEQFLTNVRTRINNIIKPEGIELSQLGFIGALRIPDNVLAALNAKIEAIQNAIKVENQLREAEAAAKIKVTNAQGEADANRILTSSLTPILMEAKRLTIQDKMANKWNGVVPQYFMGGGGPNSFVMKLPGL